MTNAALSMRHRPPGLSSATVHYEGSGTALAAATSCASLGLV